MDGLYRKTLLNFLIWGNYHYSGQIIRGHQPSNCPEISPEISLTTTYHLGENRSCEVAIVSRLQPLMRSAPADATHLDVLVVNVWILEDHLPYHPWGWYIYLHLVGVIFVVNVGTYTIHGSYGSHDMSHEQNTRILSIESWLVNIGILIMGCYNPYKTWVVKIPHII